MAEVKKRNRKQPPKRKVGRPRRHFTPEQIEQMENYAFNGCQNNTIACLMGIPQQTLEDNFREQLTKKRAERKLRLRTQQNAAAAKGNPALLIFLGKNYLEQSDKIEEKIHITGLTELLSEVDGKTKGLPK